MTTNAGAVEVEVLPQVEGQAKGAVAPQQMHRRIRILFILLVM
jgi:hypothetical protein